MAIPKYNELYPNVLNFLLDGEVHSTKDMDSSIISQLNLTEDEINEETSSGSNKIKNKISWTRSYLKAAGLIDSEKKGYFHITEEGIKAINENPNITEDYLYKYPDFVEFKKGKKDKSYTVWSMNISKSEDYDEAWNLFKQNSCISINFLIDCKDIDYTSFKNKSEIKKRLKDNIDENSIQPSVINRFVHEIKEGDIFIAHKGDNVVSGIGMISGKYTYQDGDLKHFREVNWIYDDEDIKISDNPFFSRNHIVKLSKYPDYFNELVCRIAGKNNEFRENFLNYIYNHFYDNYFSTKKGQDHLNEYSVEKDYINAVWDKISGDDSTDEDIINGIWEDIFRRDCGVLRVGAKNLRNLIQSTSSYDDEEMDKCAIDCYDVVNKVLSTSDIKEQRNILADYVTNAHSHGIKSGRLTPILFYLNKNFYPINSKTIDTVKLLSYVLDDEIILSDDLNSYIDNNIKYKEFLSKLKDSFDFDKFDISNICVFDEFCHWICSVDNYAKKGKKSKIKVFPKEILNCFSDDVPEWGNDLDVNYNYESEEKRNLIYFGAPGTGKSYNLNEKKKDLLGYEFKNNYERVTFHPDYSYANFVGTYKPVPDGKSITYDYVPGPFMRVLVKALKTPKEPFILIIEEINRANVAAVFGDVFQLLDRNDDNISEYPIHASEDMQKYLEKELKGTKRKTGMVGYLNRLVGDNFSEVKIPSNMFIWATMNSADQGVFPMDTAFKRRWDFKYLGINDNTDDIKDIKVTLKQNSSKDLDETFYWNDLRVAINKWLLHYKINEDKLLGPFFAFNEYLKKDEIPEDKFEEIFENKIIMYLFEDVARSRRDKLFSGIQNNENLTYSRICKEFRELGIGIFHEKIILYVSDKNEEKNG